MIAVLTGIHVINCLLLIVAVLLQSSKGGGLAGAFGGAGGQQAVFGGRGAATFLSKATTALAVIFMLTSLSLTVLSRGTGGAADSAVRRVLESEQRAVPAQGLPTPTNPIPPTGDGGAETAPGTAPGTAPAAGGAPAAGTAPAGDGTAPATGSPAPATGAEGTGAEGSAESGGN